MEGKDLYAQWAPKAAYTWTRYAKPALFVHAQRLSEWGQNMAQSLRPVDIPAELRRLIVNNQTVVIVDLPGVKGIEAGLALARIGIRPIPLYNGIHNEESEVLRNAVDNLPLINALVSGASALDTPALHPESKPAFLLDAERNKNITLTENIYDNRWALETDDMPEAIYLHQQNVTRVVLWTDRAVADDVAQVVKRYQESGIEAFTYTEDPPEASVDIQAAVDKFELARFAFLAAVVMGFINLANMFIGGVQPLLWTTPCIMWLTYLWLPEELGDMVAVMMSFIYLVVYILTKRRREWILVAAGLFAVDFVVFYIYALWYGIAAYTDYSVLYGIAVFVPPLVVLWLLYGGIRAYKSLRHVSDFVYEGHLHRVRGYRGYGGSGYGGYGYGGYGGFGG